MFACPNCHSPLSARACAACGFEAAVEGSVHSFYSESPIARKYREIGRFYDELYDNCLDSWNQLAGRGPEFNAWIASLVARYRPRRILEIGCGEGFLLRELVAPQRAGIEISRRAAELAAARSGAQVCIGCTEELPFVTAFFDCAVSIGVMTHFLDDMVATRQIFRVLRPGGFYLLGVFLRPSILDRAVVKCAEFRRRRPSIRQFGRWLLRKGAQAVGRSRDSAGVRSDRQPVERLYTRASLRLVLEQCGFDVREVITKRSHPESPLAGPHFRIYILRKPGA